MFLSQFRPTLVEVLPNFPLQLVPSLSGFPSHKACRTHLSATWESYHRPGVCPILWFCVSRFGNRQWQHRWWHGQWFRSWSWGLCFWGIRSTVIFQTPHLGCFVTAGLFRHNNPTLSGRCWIRRVVCPCWTPNELMLHWGPLSLVGDWSIFCVLQGGLVVILISVPVGESVKWLVRFSLVFPA